MAAYHHLASFEYSVTNPKRVPAIRHRSQGFKILHRQEAAPFGEIMDYEERINCLASRPELAIFLFMQTRYVKLLSKSPASLELLPAYLLLSLLLVLLLP